MSVSVNSESRVPPGFRFHPTEEELLQYYLRKKVEHRKIDLDVIQAVDLNKLEPWDIQEKCKIGSTPQNEWYFFSHKDKKYPTGKRTNRATAAGFWKATGRDKAIYTGFKRIGMRKTLVFYKGRAPHGEKTDWIMHEYRLSDLPHTNSHSKCSSSSAETIQDDVWVVCRVFKKKSHHKMFKSLKPTPIAGESQETKAQMLKSSGQGEIDKILPHMACTGSNDAMATKNNNTNVISTNNSKSTINNGSSSSSSSQKNMRSALTPLETTAQNGFQVRFMQLPSLESPTLPTFPNDPTTRPVDLHVKEASAVNNVSANPVQLPEPTSLNDWASLDRLIACHLNGQAETSKQLAYLFDPDLSFSSSLDYSLPLPGFRSAVASDRLFNGSHDYNSDIDLWNFTRSASFAADTLFDMSNSSL